MSVPGSNLLRMANRLIKQQVATHHRWWKNTDGDSGITTPVYYPGDTISANIQPTPRTVLVKLGLDLSQDYITVYSQAALEVKDLQRGRACDMLDFGRDRYNVETNTPWDIQDGWKGSICVKIGPVP